MHRGGFCSAVALVLLGAAAAFGAEASAPASPDSSNVVPAAEFSFAGVPRTVMDGSPPLRVSDVRPAMVLTVEGTYFATLAILHVYQENTIWRSSSSFRIRDNWDESYGANYGGHMIGGYFLSWLSAESLLACGFSTKLAPIYGALMGLGYQVYVEVLDGYGLDFALSPYEMYANIIGVAYYLGSQYSPFLQNFTPKVNYYPASWFGERAKAGSMTPIDDYSAWNNWISINVPHLISERYDSWWPSWLDVAVGYSARNLGYPDRSRVYTLALDYNVSKLLPDGSPTWNWFKRAMNFVKLPAPTIEVWSNRRPRFYVLYPFGISFATVTL